jgi:hypothetical protein
MDETAKSMVASREKWWSELTADEKIARLREIVRRQATMMREMDHRLHIVTNVNREHSHAPTGEAVIPIRTADNYWPRDTGEQISRRREGEGPDDVYF